VHIENLGIPGRATVADIIRFEKSELGNDYGISDREMETLDRYRARDALWVTRKKSEAKEYLPHGMTARDIEKIGLPPGSRIVADDGMGGYLVLMGDAELMASSPEREVEDIAPAAEKPDVVKVSREGKESEYSWMSGAEPLVAIPGEPIGYFCPAGSEDFGKAIAFLYDTGGDPPKYYIKLEDGTTVYNPRTKSDLFDDADSAKERFKMYTGEVKPGDHVVLQGHKDTYEGRVTSVRDDAIRIMTPQFVKMQWGKDAIKEIIPAKEKKSPELRAHRRKYPSRGIPSGGYWR
jgi:preprotein translocase subunit YajC